MTGEDFGVRTVQINGCDYIFVPDLVRYLLHNADVLATLGEDDPAVVLRQVACIIADDLID